MQIEDLKTRIEEATDKGATDCHIDDGFNLVFTHLTNGKQEPLDVIPEDQLQVE